MRRVLVIGGGPAGLAVAIGAAEKSARVTVHERNAHCGAKLLATGGGRANLTNARPASEWPSLFGRHGRFIVPALEFFTLEKLRRWFADLGLPLACPDGFHFFPQSNSARDVRDALLSRALGLGVSIEYNSRIEALPDDGDVRVIIATGGKSMPASGSTGDGWRLAESAGHRVAPPFPGLVGLRAGNLSPELAGLVLPDARTFFKVKGKSVVTGDRELLLTHTGISGPAVLDISASVAQAAAESAEKSGDAIVTLRWLAGMDTSAWLSKLADWRKSKGASPVASLLKEFLPQRLAKWLCRLSRIDESAGAATLGAAQRDTLAANLGSFPARVTDSEGWDKAMITRGGVDLSGVKPDTLESRLRPGLFFAGEVLDIDGPCGGYNLHWAFASGALAGATAAATD